MKMASGTETLSEGRVLRSVDARCEEHEALGDNNQTPDITRERGPLTLDLISASATACAIPTPSSGEVPLPTSSISTKDLGVARPTGERRGITEAQGWNTYRVSLHNLPSHWQTCSNSSPCRHRSKAAKVVNRVSYANVNLYIYDGLGDPHYSPEARILRRNKTSTHSHDRKQPNLSEVRALS